MSPSFFVFGAMRYFLLILIFFATIGCGTSPSRNSSSVVFDLDDRAITIKPDFFKSRVIIFLKTDCPIGNRYAPKISRLAKQATESGLDFTLVYPDTDLSSDEVRQHAQEYSLELPALRDPDHRLVKITGVTIAPEAAVYDGTGLLIYRGRIDDRYVDFGKARPAPTTDDLYDVIDAFGKADDVAEPRITKAVGCYIE